MDGWERDKDQRGGEEQEKKKGEMHIGKGNTVGCGGGNKGPNLSAFNQSVRISIWIKGSCIPWSKYTQASKPKWCGI